MTNSEKSDRAFSITLDRHRGTEQWVVGSAAVIQDDLVHRVTFKKNNGLTSVFCKGIVNFLKPILNEFHGDNRVYANPDAEVRLPGLVLRRARVVYTFSPDGLGRAIVRFAVAFGNLQSALLVKTPFDSSVTVAAEKMTVELLDQVLLPALNIAGIQDTSELSDSAILRLEKRLERLRQSKEELLLQIELVKNNIATERARLLPDHSSASDAPGQHA